MNIWNKEFYKEGGQSEDPIFRIPHQDLPKFIRLLKKQNAQNILDLGCGTGRDVIALAKDDFNIYGLDISKRATKRTQQWLSAENLSGNIRIGNMHQSLPYADNTFDGVISIKAMHHATVADIKKLIHELERTMRPGGILMIEVPKTDQKQQAKGPHKEIEPGTLVFSEGAEKGVPHHTFKDKEELETLFHNFEILDIYIMDQTKASSPHFIMFARFKA